jgi:hypothetical protein
MYIQGFLNNKEQGVKILSDSDHDASIYIGDYCTLTSNKYNTILRTNELVLDTKITINDINETNGEWIPTYVSINKRGTLVVKKYKMPFYVLCASFIYFTYYWFSVGKH